NNMMPQFNKILNLKFNNANFTLGIIILLIGLIKKLIFADTLSIFVDNGFNNTENLTFIYSWILSLSFTFQLYFDFSGYIDMATGSALMLNIFLPRNFNSPFKSLSVIDFWKRWHITLSEFLTNYIYSPWIKSLNEISFFKSMLIIIIVFLIAGIWHGASWCFILFGLTHGLGLVINHIYKKITFFKINKILSWFLTFNFINLSFVLFRSENITQSKNIFIRMFDFNFLNQVSNYNDLKLYYDFINIKFLSIFFLSFVICLFFNNSFYLIEKYKKINFNKR
ncbi:MBOAT family protein, partial [Candidatus Pelagibacter sp.]|nr:MBOAT family protein [Candidatus Pelagibacter sp.]